MSLANRVPLLGLGLVLLVIAPGCSLVVNQGAKAPPRVVAPEIVVLEGQEPVPWRVEVASGDGGRWCAQGDFGDDPQSVGDVCNQLVGPDGVAQADGFGMANANVDPAGRVLAWGTTSREASSVVAVLPDGTRTPAEIAVGPMPFVVWAVAMSEQPVQFEAFARGGAQIGARGFG